MEGLAILAAGLSLFQFWQQRHAIGQAYGKRRSDLSAIASETLSVLLVFLVTRFDSILAGGLVLVLTAMAIVITRDDWSEKSGESIFRLGLAALLVDVAISGMVVVWFARLWFFQT